MVQQVVDLGPMSWRQSLHMLLAVIENGSKVGRADAIGELERMAAIADRAVHRSYVENGKADQAKRYAEAAGIVLCANCEQRPAIEGASACAECGVEALDAINEGKY